MNKFILNITNHRLRLITIYLFGLTAFGLILLLTHRIPGSDDFAFQKQIMPYPTVFDWLSYRYTTWSGRIFSESFVYIFSPLPLIFWKIASLTLYALFTGFTFLYYLLFTKKRSHIKDYVMLIVAFILPFLMDTQVLTEGMLWVTGSMNYFWLVTFGVIAFYPILYCIVKNKLPHWSFLVAGAVSTIVAASSHEQVGIVLVALALLLSVYFLITKTKNRTILLYLFGLTILSIVSFIVGIKAPGNSARVAFETTIRLPDFYTIPLLDHIQYAYRWLLDALINRLGVLLAATWALLVLLFVNKKRSRRLDKLDFAIIAILSVSCLYLCFKGFDAVKYWFDFRSSWKAETSKSSFVVLLPWTISLIATVTAPIILYRKKIIGILVASLLAAVIACAGLMMFSPTMYASGFRPLYVSSIILSFVVYFLFDRAYDYNDKIARIIFAILLFLAGSQFMLLLMKTIIH